MVGINTLLRDDPRLTIRHPRWKDKPLTRVVADSRLRFPLGARMLGTKAKGDIIIFTRPDSSPRKAAALERRGVRVVTVPGKGTGINLRAALAWLGQHKIASLLVEGGGALAYSLFQDRLADKVVLCLSPKLIGGPRAPSLVAGRGAARLSEALSLKETRVFSLGSDIVVEGNL
jgi:diaminohydroxyphosphoribosylaminopyrimidine deaminase/5-amino-6-(5-phosphoribosylamino)uracil reductase